MDLILVVSSCLTNESEEKVADWRKAVVIAEGRRRHWPHRDNWSEVEDEGTVQLHWSFLHPLSPKSNHEWGQGSLQKSSENEDLGRTSAPANEVEHGKNF